jgi:hypothetical protein
MEIQFNLGITAWLFDHPVRPRQHIRRDCQADLHGCHQIE